MKRIIKHWMILLFLFAGFQPPCFAMSEAELQQLYLDVVESSVDVFEPIWTDDSGRIPNSGFFDFRKYPDWRDDPYATIIVIPGNGMVQFCYAVLLTETDKQSFGEKQISRRTLLERAIQSMRWCCLTSSYVENPYPYLPNTREDFADGPYWRRRLSWRADEIGWMTLAAGILWDRLDADTQKQLEDVFVGGAPQERLVQTWKPPQGGNHDQIKQDLSSAMGAAYLLRQRFFASKYLEILSGNGIDMVSTEHDFAQTALADGKPVSEWAEGWNLYPDYSSDHHGWCNLWYGSDLIFEGRSYIEILRYLKNTPAPEAFTYPGNGFDGVLQWLKTLCLPEGEPLSPHGNEYDSYYGAGLLAYCYGATIQKDSVAAALEERAATLLQRHSKAIRAYDYHRNSWAKAAVAHLMHKINGPWAEPASWSEAAGSLEGVYHYRWHQNLIHRDENKIASFAWGSISSVRNISSYYGNGLCGFIFPAQAEEGISPLVYGYPNSLIGDIRITDSSGKARQPAVPESLYTYRMDDGCFHTTGCIPDPALERFYAFHSFDDGPCMMFTLFKAQEDLQLNWSGLPLYFYVREGLTGSRSLYSTQGAQTLEKESLLESGWWCVDDRIGAIFSGKNPAIHIQRSTGYNWARKESYKDKCDGVFMSPLQDAPMKKNEAFRLPAAFYTNTPHQQLADLNRQGLDCASAPEGWMCTASGDPLHPGRRYLAASRFYGSESRAILRFVRQSQNPNSFFFAEGAPVLSLGTELTDQGGVIVVPLDALDSFGETIDMYAETLDGKTIFTVKKAMGVYQFNCPDSGLASLRLRYRGDKEFPLPPDSYIASPGIENSELRPVIEKLLDKNADFVDVRFEDELTIDLGLSGGDRVGPAVEIHDLSIREDQRVKIEVMAGDRSGVQSVRLYCDGALVSEKTSRPFVWTHRPGSGYHTYYATAKDSSERNNARSSFKRTIKIE